MNLDSPKKKVQPDMPNAKILSGIRVIEYGNFISAPYCARLLADCGADVIKVEPLKGDASRKSGPFPNDIPNPNVSGLYTYLNFNKRAMTLDIATANGRDILIKLITNSDVFIANGDSQVLRDLGLLYTDLKSINKNLVVVSITPYGLTGDYKTFKGDDLTITNFSSLAYATPGIPDMAEDQNTEYPLKSSTSLSDFISGIQASIAIQAALIAREFNMSGGQIDISQAESTASLMLWDLCHASYLQPKSRGPVVFGSMPNAYLPCSDGYVAIVAFSDKHWNRLVDAMGNPDWAMLEVFSNATERSRNWDALKPFIMDWTMQHTGEEITNLSQSYKIPCIHAHSISEIMNSDHMKSREAFLTLTLGENVEFQAPGFPIRMNEIGKSHRPSAPTLGQHNEEILTTELKYAKKDLEILRRWKII